MFPPFLPETNDRAFGHLTSAIHQHLSVKIRSNSGDGERHGASTNHRSIPAVRSKASASTEVASCHRCINKELPTTRAAADRIASSVSSDSCGE